MSYDCPTAYKKINDEICSGTDDRTGFTCPPDSFAPSNNFFDNHPNLAAYKGNCIKKYIKLYNEKTCPGGTIVDVGSQDFNFCVLGKRGQECEYKTYKSFEEPLYKDNICIGPTSPDCSPEGQRYRAVKCMDSDGNISDESKCEGAKPAQQQACTPPPSYSWSAPEFGDCVASIGGGTKRTREVVCKSSSGKLVADELCQFNDKPADTKSCYYNWLSPAFDSVCLEDGKQHRKIGCQDDKSKDFELGVCDALVAGARPADSQDCTYSYTYGDFGECVKGQKTRSVLDCKDNLGASYADCSSYIGKPVPETAKCATYEWVVGEWQATAPSVEGFAIKDSGAVFNYVIFGGLAILFIGLIVFYVILSSKQRQKIYRAIN